MSKQAYFKLFSFAQVRSLHVKTVLFRAILFSLSMQFNCIWLIYRTVLGVTIPCPSGSGSNANEGVLCIPQSSSIIGTSPSDCLVLYPEHSLGVGVLPLGKETVCVFYSRLGKRIVDIWFLLPFYYFILTFPLIYS